jgi:hypothetical protein
MSLPDDLKARVLAAAQKEPSPTVAVERRRHRLVGAAAVATALACFLAAGGVHLGSRAGALVVGSVAGAATIALLAAWIGLSRGSSMLGRPRWTLLTVALAVPPLLVAWKLWWSARFTDMQAVVPGRPGLRCFGLSLVLSIAPLAAILWARRGRDSVHPRALGAAVAVAVGAVVWIAVDGWCPIGDPRHVLVGHWLPLELLAVAGALMGGEILAVRAKRRRPAAPPAQAQD